MTDRTTRGLSSTLAKLVAGMGLAAVTASAAVNIPGYLTYEYYPGKNRDDVEAGTAGTPSTDGAVVGSDKSGYVAILESGTNFAEGYANRFYGYFVPPADGDYVFFIAGDDDSDLFLSTDATPANKKKIATEAGWSAVRSYNSVGGTSTVEDKRSDKYTASEWPGASGAGATIKLTKGQKYYIEAVHHEGGGGDNIAVTYKLATEADPKNGDTPRLSGAVISTDVPTAPAAPNISIAAQPVGGTFYTVAPMTLAVLVNSDSPFPVAYQWRKGNSPIPNATGRTYTVGSPTANDNGSYDVQASVPGPDGKPVVVTSTPVTVTVNTPQISTVTGQLKYEYFPNSDRGSVEGGTAQPGGSGPAGNDGNGLITIAESGTNFADNYANRISGYFIAPDNGNYVFYIAGDDDSDLFLSTDSNPANKKLIAQESGWSGVRRYATVGGGSTTENKRSDSFTGSQWPGASGAGATIKLVKGSKYYIEAVHHEGGGGDNLAVTYRLDTEDEALAADGEAPRLTGPVIAVDVAKIMSIASVNSANISKLSFAINDSSPSVLDPASVTVTVDGKTVAAVAGTKDANGSTPFTATYSAPFAQGSSHTYSITAKDTQGQSVTRNDAFTIGTAWWPKEDLKGPAVAEKKINSRFIFGVKDAAGNNVQITGLANIFKILQASGSPDFTTGNNNPKYTGVIVDAPTDVINWNGGGLFGNNNPYPDAATGDGSWTGEDFINLNIINLVIPEESDYTFGVHSDDGFAMRIRGGVAVSVNGNGQLDPVDPEAVVHPADTGDSSTRAVYHLRKGVYRLEFFWWERGGGDNGEIYAAKGAFKNDGDTPTWRLLNDPTPSQELTLLGVDAAGWTVTSSDPGGDQLNTWADANTDLAATEGGAKTYDYLNVGDPDTNGGTQAFPKDNKGKDDDDYALRAKAKLVVPQDGTYLIGFNTDDGGYMKINGQTFTVIDQNNTGSSVISGDSVTCDCLTGDSGTLAEVTLKAGNYDIEFGMFERGGGSYLAGRGALKPAAAVQTSDIPFLTKSLSGTKVKTASGLQATSAPADGGGQPSTQPMASISHSGTSVTITSDSGGTVQKAASFPVTGSTAWSDVGPAPQTVPATGAQQFFRIKK